MRWSTPVMFWLFAGTAAASGVGIVVVAGMLAVRTIGRRLGEHDMISLHIFLALCAVCVALPLVLIIEQLRGRVAPLVWRLLGWVAGLASAALGAWSVANDPADSAWFGVALIVFGVALTASSALHGKEFNP